MWTETETELKVVVEMGVEIDLRRQKGENTGCRKKEKGKNERGPGKSLHYSWPKYFP